jgi:hypothetical protein
LLTSGLVNAQTVQTLWNRRSDHQGTAMRLSTDVFVPRAHPVWFPSSCIIFL